MKSSHFITLLLLLLLLACGEEEAPWQVAFEELSTALAEADPTATNEYLTGGKLEELGDYLALSEGLEATGDWVSEGELRLLPVLAPGRPGLTLVWREVEGDWLLDTALTLEATRASALNAIFAQ
ncbi:hypothetical protein K8R78_06070 [bacterium]|nr:hypothetical protein [bacterium]